MTRQIVKKRVSFLDKKGDISWTMREGTIFVCPLAHKDKTYDENAVTSQPGSGNVTNKKLKISDMYSDEPITVRKARLDMKE